MSNDDRPTFSVVSNEDIEVSEHGVLTRKLIFDEDDGSPEFMAGIYIGTIITQLQQAIFGAMEFDQLHPMPAPKSHQHVVQRVAEYFKASVEFEAVSDDDEMLWCSFTNKRSTLRVV